MADQQAKGVLRLVSAVALSAALAPLNSTMIAVALPEMQSSFHASSDVLRQRLVTSYLLTSIVLQSLGGKFSDRVGHKSALALGQVMFATAATLGYFVSSLPVLTLARVTMAAAGAVIVPSALALLRSELPAQYRGRAFGVFGAMMSLSAATGPKLGALLVTHFGWPAIFLANVPVLLVSGLLAHVGVRPNVTPPRAKSSFDVVGALLFALSLTLLVLSTERASRGLWAILGAFLLLPFVWWERRAADPLIELSLLKLRPFMAGSLIIALQNFAMYSLLFELPQVAARLFGAKTHEVGSALFAMMAAMVVASPLGGRASERFGSRAIALSGCACSLLGMVGLWLRPFHAFSDALLPMMAIGFGLGLTSPASQSAALSSVAKEKSGMAAGLTSTMRYLGGMAGLSVLTLVLSDRQPAEVVRAEHRLAVTIFCGALLAALACALMLPAPRRAEREG